MKNQRGNQNCYGGGREEEEGRIRGTEFYSH